MNNFGEGLKPFHPHSDEKILQLGELLYIKYTPKQFFELSGEMLPHGYKIGVPKLEEQYGILTSVPVLIDKNTRGNYECVHKNGVKYY